MKKAISTCLLLILLTNGVALYLYYVVQLFRIHSEMRAEIKSPSLEKLTTLRLSRSEYKAFRVDDHEVKVNGKMYDIVSIESAGDTLNISCIHDTDEDDLLTVVHQVFAGPVNQENIPLPLILFTTLVFVKPFSQIDVSRFPSKYRVIAFYNLSVTACHLSLEPPPPEC